MHTIFIIFTIFGASMAVRVPRIRLNDGRDIPALGLGTSLGKEDKKTGEEVKQAVYWALEAGYRHIDTAYMYRVEDQVGRGVARGVREGLVRREDIFITTKLWLSHHARDAVVPGLRNQLQDLNMDYVDLYLIHWPVGLFDNLTLDKSSDYIETWRGMIEAKQLGLTKSIGVSNFNEQQMERIAQYGLETPAVLEVEVNLNLQQQSLRAYCRTRNIAVIGYTPFGSLFSSRAAPDAPLPRQDTPELLAIAQRHNKTVPQIALRYVFELGVIPIPKSITKSRIEENIDIFDFSLTQEEKNLLRSYDNNYRIFIQNVWTDHPHYPFEDIKSKVAAARSRPQKVASVRTNDVRSRSRFPGFSPNFRAGSRNEY